MKPIWTCFFGRTEEKFSFKQKRSDGIDLIILIFKRLLEK